MHFIQGFIEYHWLPAIQIFIEYRLLNTTGYRQCRYYTTQRITNGFIEYAGLEESIAPKVGNTVGSYRGTSLIDERQPVGPYSRTMSRALWKS